MSTLSQNEKQNVQYHPVNNNYRFGELENSDIQV